MFGRRWPGKAGSLGISPYPAGGRAQVLRKLRRPRNRSQLIIDEFPYLGKAQSGAAISCYGARSIAKALAGRAEDKPASAILLCGSGHVP